MVTPRIPGTAWIALIGALTAWVQQSFPDAAFAPYAVIIGGALIKGIDVYIARPKETVIEVVPKDEDMQESTISNERGYLWTSRARVRGKLERFLLG